MIVDGGKLDFGKQWQRRCWAKGPAQGVQRLGASWELHVYRQILLNGSDLLTAEASSPHRLQMIWRRQHGGPSHATRDYVIS